MFTKKFLFRLIFFLSLFSLLSAEEAPDTSRWAKGPSREWHLTLESAQASAAKKNKKIYVLFTGSDWCGFCVKLKKEVLTNGRFKSYAKKNLELVYIDFPRKKKSMPAEQREYNSALRQKLGGGGGVPSALILDASGKVIGKVSGYRPLKQYMASLQNPTPFTGRNERRVLKPTGPSVPPPGWHTSLETALEKAKAGNRKVLVLRTGSDWCPPCMRLEREALSSEVFKKFAEKHLELVFLDSPRRKTISPEQKAYNAKTAQALKMGNGVPSLVIVDASGKVTARQMGYRDLRKFMTFLKKGVNSSSTAAVQK